MTKKSSIILLTDVIEQKLRKEKELDFYLEELEKLQLKINYLRREVNLTNTIIDMIQNETVYEVGDATSQPSLLPLTESDPN